MDTANATLAPRRVSSRLLLLSLLLPLLLSTLTAHTAFASTTIIDRLSEQPRFSRLIHSLQTTRLIPFLNNKTADGLTLFAVANDRFDVRSKDAPDRKLLKYHILRKETRSSEFSPGALLTTALVRPDLLGSVEDEGQRLKIGTDDGKVSVGGCKLLEADIRADNGIIHVVDCFMKLPSMLAETLQSLPNLKDFTGKVESSEINKLIDRPEHFTIFAPIDSAYERIDDVTRRYLDTSYAKQDVQELLKYHIHRGATYIYGMKDGGRSLPTLIGASHKIEKITHKNTTTYDGYELEETDILAANGVIHTIPHIFLPPDFRIDAYKYLIGTGHTKFVDLFIAHNLTRYLTDHSRKSPVTIFAVDDSALFADSADDENAAGDQLKYHIVEGAHPRSAFSNDVVLETALKSKGMNGRSQVIKVKVSGDVGSKIITIGGAKVVDGPVDIDGALIYTVSRLLEVPVDPVQSIVGRSDLSAFLGAIQFAKLDRILRRTRSVTALVPNDLAFGKQSALMAYLSLPDSTEKLRKILRYHLINGVIYAKDLPTSKRPTLELPTLEGRDNITINLSESDGLSHLTIHGDGTRSAEFAPHSPEDHPTTNGNYLTIDHLLLPSIVPIHLENLLDGLGAATMIRLLTAADTFPHLNATEKDPFTILVPSEQAFKKIDMVGLLLDPKRVAPTVGMHVVRGRAELKDGARWKTEREGVWIGVADIGEDGWDLEIVDETGSRMEDVRGGGGRARVGKRGEARNGNVYQIDRFFVYVPQSRSVWFIISLVLIVLALVSLVGVAAWYLVQTLLRRRRAGYQPIDEEEEGEREEQE